MPVLKDVTFLYSHLTSPVDSYNKTDKQWEISAVVSKGAAKNWNLQFKKQKAKDYPTEEFQEKFRVAPPFPDQDDQFVVKLKKKTTYKDGTPIKEEHRPRAFIRKNGALVDITDTLLIANGSKGTIQYDVVESEFGTSARLANVRVDKLIEYKRKGQDMSELDGGDDTEIEGNEENDDTDTVVSPSNPFEDND